jgi:hypothetical protein
MTQASGISHDVRSLLCPVDPERLCPARVRLANLYDTPSDPIQAEVLEQSGLSPRLDTIKLSVKLAEHHAQAKLRGCVEPTDDRCPVWVEMTQSPARKSTVTGLRSLLRITRGNNG